MVQSGAVEAAASSPEAFEVNAYVGGGEVVFTGAGMPERGYWHHFGSESRTTKWGTPNPLPQRAFIGIDTDTQLAIVAEFDAWMGAIVGGFDIGGGGGSSVSIFTHASGRQQFRVGGWWGPNV
jgi:N-acetylglucosamine kinase-like BadF-type ATPase